MVRMIACINFRQLSQLVWEMTRFTTNIRNYSFNFMLINFFKVIDLVIDDHTIGQHINIRIFGVGHQSATKRIENKFLTEDIGVIANEVGNHTDR